jgi:hypothetical protein
LSYSISSIGINSNLYLYDGGHHLANETDLEFTMPKQRVEVKEEENEKGEGGERGRRTERDTD